MRVSKGTYCSAVNCSNNKGRNPELHFFTFPKDPERCKKWVINSRREDLLTKNVKYLNENCRLCLEHFENSQFMNSNKNSLIKTAVPTVFSISNTPNLLAGKRKTSALRNTTSVPKKPRLEEMSESTQYGSTAGSSYSNGEFMMFWDDDSTKKLIELYEKYIEDVGTMKIRSIRQMWEAMSEELSAALNRTVTKQHCENRWRVLERNYKKHMETKNTPGKWTRSFEYANEMERLCARKRSIQPVGELQVEEGEEENGKKKKTALVLEQMRMDRLEYQTRRLEQEERKIALLERKVKLLEENSARKFS